MKEMIEKGTQIMSPRRRRLLVRVTRLLGIRWVQHGFRRREFRNTVFVVATTILFLAVPSLALFIPSDWSPLIGMAALFVAVPIHIWFLSSRDKRIAREFEAKKCPICGYDLRASRLRCPECGNVVRIKPLKHNPPARKTTSAPRIERPKGFFGALAAFAVGFSANDRGRLDDALSLSRSWLGRIELLSCLIVCPLISATSLALLLFGRQPMRTFLIVPTFAIFLGAFWLLGHIHLLQKRRVHICPLCGESFKGIRRACPSCGEHSEVTDAPTVVTSRVQNWRDLRSFLHSPKGRTELLLCLIVCPVIGIALMVGVCKADLRLSTLAFGALFLVGIFITPLGFVWLIGRIFLMQSRQRHTCRACGRKFKGAWKCPHCGSDDVITVDDSPATACERSALYI